MGKRTHIRDMSDERLERHAKYINKKWRRDPVKQRDPAFIDIEFLRRHVHRVSIVLGAISVSALGLSAAVLWFSF